MILVMAVLIAFIFSLAGMIGMVVRMYVSGRPAVVTSLLEVTVDVFLLGVAMVIAVVALIKYLKEA